MITTTAPTTTEKLRALPWSYAANGANSIYAQLTFFGPVFVLFLDELSISNTEIGFLLSLVPFMGLIALFIVPYVARFGYKRTFITFWGARKGFAALLLLVPWVSIQFGTQAALLLVTIIVGGFSLCRAIAETGYYPWQQEFVPDSVRGKYAATNTIISNLVSIGAVAVATFVLGLTTDMNRFLLLFVVGTAAGLIGVLMYTRIPGGAPSPADNKQGSYHDLLQAAKDKNLQIYLAGIFLFTFGTGPLYSFLPLFMSQQVQLSDGGILSLQISVLIGGLISSQLLGWSADRYGSKPVMLSGVIMTLILPFGWLAMPRGTESSLIIANILAFFQGVAGIAWGVGSGKLLFVKVVPTAQKAEYMAVYYAAIGLIGGFSQIMGGSLLDGFKGVSGQFMFIVLDEYAILIILSIILTALSLPLFQYVKSDSDVSISEFAGFFIHGNPLYALETMVRFYRAKDEKAVVRLTARLGHTKSPLTVDEMLDALNDPRFNVRFEAIISIARMNPAQPLTDALIALVHGTELSLSVMAAWALGRIGDVQALPALREGLDSEYKSIRAHCARALGTLGDREIIPILHERLKVEEDKGLQIAYAATLASLQAHDTIETIFKVMEQTQNDKARMEITLSLARIVEDEHHFVTLLRQIRTDSGTAIAQELTRCRNRFDKHPETNGNEHLPFETAIREFASGDLSAGVNSLLLILEALPMPYQDEVTQKLLDGCIQGLRQWGLERMENVILSLTLLSLL